MTQASGRAIQTERRSGAADLSLLRSGCDLVQRFSDLAERCSTGPIAGLLERPVEKQRGRCHKNTVVVEERFIFAPQHSDSLQIVTFRKSRGGFLISLGADAQHGEALSFLSSKLLDLAGFRVTRGSTRRPQPHEHGASGSPQRGEIHRPTAAQVDQIERWNRLVRIRSVGLCRRRRPGFLRGDRARDRKHHRGDCACNNEPTTQPPTSLQRPQRRVHLCAPHTPSVVPQAVVLTFRRGELRCDTTR